MLKLLYKMAALLTGCLLLTLVSCRMPGSGTPGVTDLPGYSAGQTAVIAAAEKKRYEAVLGNGIWQIVPEGTGETGKTFEEILKEEIRSFMEELRVICYLADEREILLTKDEETAMKEAGKAYYGALTAEERTILSGIGEEDIAALYCDYMRARKLADSFAGMGDLEVSDSEARVITVLSADTEDRETAERLSATAARDKSEFSAAARELGLDVREETPGRGSAGDDAEAARLEDAMFALGSGEVSSVIGAGGRYYVVFCVNDYEEELTAKRKELLFRQRIQTAFRLLYEQSLEKVNVVTDEGIYQNLSLSDPSLTVGPDFFEIYHQYTE